MPKFLYSLKLHLLGIVIVSMLPALAIILYSRMELRDYDIRNAHEHVLDRALALAQEQEQITVRTKQMLDMLVLMPELRSGNSEIWHRKISDVHRASPEYTGLYAARPDGRVFAASVPIPLGLNLSDRKYFREAVRTGGFVVGEYILGRATGRHAINYARPFYLPSGQMAGIIVVGFDLAQYRRLISQKAISDGYVLTIADHRGVRLYRHPNEDDPVTGVGTSLLPDTMAKILSPAPEGTHEGIGSDGVQRIYAYKRLYLEGAATPYMIVLAGLHKEKALQAADETYQRSLAFLGLSALLSLLLTWTFGKVAILNRLNKLFEATARIGGGDLSARTGIPYDSGEFGHLAEAFDEMSASLEEKTRALQRSEFRYKQLVENARDMIVRIDLKGRYTFVNSVTLQIAGYSEEEMLGRPYFDFVPSEFRQAAVDFYGEQIRNRTLSTYMEFPLITKDGRDLWMGHNVQLVMDGDEIQGFQAISRDISERKHMEEELEKAAITDPLTGIYNRRGFILMASHQLLLAERARQGLILCFIDLDDMKQINDEAGHEEGDHALLEATAILRDAFRGSDIVARIGGDEFAVLAVGSTVDHWGVLRERLQQQIDQHNAEPGRKYMISMSCGMAYYNPAESCTIDELMARADTLMYDEKRAKKEAASQPL